MICHCMEMSHQGSESMATCQGRWWGNLNENPFLSRVRLHTSSLRIGVTPAGIPTAADANCMLSSHNGAQTQLYLAQQNAAKTRHVLSTTKSKVLHIIDKSSKGLDPQPLQFNNSNIEYSTKETHLGLSVASTL